MRQATQYIKFTIFSIIFTLLIPSTYLFSQEKDTEAGQAIQNTQPKEVIIDDFEKGQTEGVFYKRETSLGTYQGTWAKRPSYTIITKTEEPNRGKILGIEFKKEGGWCGWYTLLQGLDASNFNSLTFWVKGEEGGERFDIGLADQRMQDLEIDAVYAGPVKAFIEGGEVTKEWKKVRIPLARVGSEIDIKHMGSIVLWFRYGGVGKIYMDDIKLENDPEITKIEEYNMPIVLNESKAKRSMWVWKIDPVENPRAKEDLFRLCERGKINVIYLYFGDYREGTDKEYDLRLEEFLNQAKQKNIGVEALTGNPVWALKENHQAALVWLEEFLKFNKNHQAKFRGVSFDVEPYLTNEWNSDRERIKADYIVLLEKCRNLIEKYGGNFEIGVAIPIFYDKEDNGEFEKKILEYMDYIALMDYYDTAKDIIKGAQFHLDLAAKMNKYVILGVETQDLVTMQQGKRRNTFFEEGWEEMEMILKKVESGVDEYRSFWGIGMHCYCSYRLLTRGRNVPTRERPKDNYQIMSYEKSFPIKIDGNLEEWNNIEPFRIIAQDNVVYGAGAWEGKDDLSVKVWSAWDKTDLYLVFDVLDSKLVQERSGGDLWEGDHIELWLDVDLVSDLNEAVNSNDDFQIGLSPGNFSNLKPEVYIWTPSVDENLLGLIEIAAQKKEDGYTIEVKIPQDVLFSSIEPRVGVEPLTELSKIHYIYRLEGSPYMGFHKGFKMGIMVDGSDTDDKFQPQKCLVSSSKDRVWGDPTVFGILNFVGKPEDVAAEQKSGKK